MKIRIGDLERINSEDADRIKEELRRAGIGPKVVVERRGPRVVTGRIHRIRQRFHR